MSPNYYLVMSKVKHGVQEQLINWRDYNSVSPRTFFLVSKYCSPSNALLARHSSTAFEYKSLHNLLKRTEAASCLRLFCIIQN